MIYTVLLHSQWAWPLPALQLIAIISEPLQSLQSLHFYNDLHSFAPYPVAMAAPAPQLVTIISEPLQSFQSLTFYNDLHSFAPSQWPYTLQRPAWF